VGNSLGDTGSHQTKPWIADGGSSGVRDEHKLLPSSQAGDEFRKTPFLIVLMEANEQLTGIQMGQKKSCAPCILGNDNVATPESLRSPKRQIPKITDRRAEKREGRQLRYSTQL
jgi:hypothetical protein